MTGLTFGNALAFNQDFNKGDLRLDRYLLFRARQGTTSVKVPCCPGSYQKL